MGLIGREPTGSILVVIGTDVELVKVGSGSGKIVMLVKSGGGGLNPSPNPPKSGLCELSQHVAQRKIGNKPYSLFIRSSSLELSEVRAARDISGGYI